MYSTHATHPDDLERLARRRAGAKLGWLMHAAVYVAVNLMLAALSVHALSKAVTTYVNVEPSLAGGVSA